MPAASDTVALMVTRDGERFIQRQCESIAQQTLRPAALVIVDDGSTDGTRDIARDVMRSTAVPTEIIRWDGSHHADLKTRVASAVTKGLEAVAGFGIVVLSDQDDEWLPDRVAIQRQALVSGRGSLLVAGDAILIDDCGIRLDRTLRDHFPVPASWSSMDPAGRMRAALRMPLATGAASAMAAELIQLMLPIPPGWLHDRWATLVAAARVGLDLQDDVVVAYRVHDTQNLGLIQAEVGSGGRRWSQILARGAGPVEALQRCRVVVQRIGPLAVDAAVRSELSYAAVLGSALDRA
jgi:glycosyltransferase involved in cell wall biosynthesis